MVLNLVLNLVPNLVLNLGLAKRIQNKAIVNETRSVEELGALLAKAESAFDMQMVRYSRVPSFITVARRTRTRYFWRTRIPTYFDDNLSEYIYPSKQQ